MLLRKSIKKVKTYFIFLGFCTKDVVECQSCALIMSLAQSHKTFSYLVSDWIKIFYLLALFSELLFIIYPPVLIDAALIFGCVNDFS